MPYPAQYYPSGVTAGREISPPPTQGGSKLTLAEGLVTAPNDPPQLGDAALVGAMPGVVVTPPSGAGADCVFQTSGVFSLPVVASDDQGTEDIAVGDPIYIDDSSAVLSVDATSGHTLFGFALNALSGSASASNICVKLKTS